MISKITQKIKKLKIPMACLFFVLLAMPAFGNDRFSKIEINNFNKLTSYRETGVSFLANRIGMLANITSTNNGFVLCELLNLGDTKLNICYLKKGLKTMPILDLNRLFLEVKLDF
ncbi:MAG: hypothetical protein FP812_20345 [Desulfobacula sp.]|nr:hypothetical protein [Desulfobacula sp.]